MPTYRSVPDDRITDFQNILQYAFSPSEPPETDEERPDSVQLGSRRGLFDGEELLCTCAHHWFSATVRGGDHPLAGLSAVATPPENRRQGLIARLLAESLAEYRERGQYLAALWPFSYSFYRQYGWAQAGSTATYECDPEALSFAAGDGDRFRELDVDEFEAMDRVLDAHTQGISLSIRRSEDWWRHRIFESWDTDPYVYGVERDGDLRGYVVYTVESDDGRTMRVRELAAIDHEASLDLLRFLYYHDSQVERVRIRGRPSTLLFDLANDPRAIDCELTPGGMVRIVDVERALSALDYPTDSEGRLVLSVRDSTVDWNDDTFALEVADGKATCERVDERPDATVPITTLSRLFVGHFSVERATLVGDLAVESPEIRKFLEELFPSGAVFLNANF